MTSQQEIQRYRTIERRHMIVVKDALAVGLDRFERGEPPGACFVFACIKYLEFIMGRFIRQGRGNVKRLESIVPASDAANRRVLADIDATLGECSEHVERLAAAREAMDEANLAATCRAFLDFYNGTLARRKDPAQAIVEQYVDTEAYWRDTNDVTDASIDTEHNLFLALTHIAPDIIQPDSESAPPS